MAGFLPNVPGVRIPYHRDGSLVKIAGTSGYNAWTLTGGWSLLSNGNAAEINDGDTTGLTWFSSNGVAGYGAMIAIVFPQAVTLTGHNLLANTTNASDGQLLWSSDTVDGTDGTWTAEAANYSGSLTPTTIRGITSVNIPNVKAVRVAGWTTQNYQTVSLYDAQLYGQWSPQTLAAWHPTLDQQINGHELDFGDVLLGNIYNKQFRIKNGQSLTANNVVVSCTTGTAEFISGLTLSLDGTTFTSTVTIPSIAPGAVSGTVYVRRTVSAGQSPNIMAMAPIDFIATTWT